MSHCLFQVRQVGPGQGRGERRRRDRRVGRPRPRARPRARARATGARAPDVAGARRGARRIVALPGAVQG